MSHALLGNNCIQHTEHCCFRSILVPERGLFVYPLLIVPNSMVQLFQCLVLNVWLPLEIVCTCIHLDWHAYSHRGSDSTNALIRAQRHQMIVAMKKKSYTHFDVDFWLKCQSESKRKKREASKKCDLEQRERERCEKRKGFQHKLMHVHG